MASDSTKSSSTSREHHVCAICYEALCCNDAAESAPGASCSPTDEGCLEGEPGAWIAPFGKSDLFERDDAMSKAALDIQVLPCKHEFHAECISPWEKDRNSCPLCRTKIDSSRPDQEGVSILTLHQIIDLLHSLIQNEARVQSIRASAALEEINLLWIEDPPANDQPRRPEISRGINYEAFEEMHLLFDHDSLRLS